MVRIRKRRPRKSIWERRFVRVSDSGEDFLAVLLAMVVSCLEKVIEGMAKKIPRPMDTANGTWRPKIPLHPTTDWRAPAATAPSAIPMV